MTLTSPGEARVGFRRHLRSVVASGEGVYLLSARGVSVLEGRHLEALAPLLDGTRTLSAVLREAAPQVPVATAGQLLGQLARADLIGYHAPASPDESGEAYWNLAGVDGVRAGARVASTPVGLTVLGRVDADQVRQACQDSGLAVTDRPAPALTLVCCDDYLDPRLSEIAAQHRADGRHWLLARPSGPEVWVGPIFGDPDRGCWACLAHRVRGHRRAEGPVMRALGIDGPAPVPDASLAAGRALGVQLAVLAAARWVAGVADPHYHAVARFDTLTGALTRHPMVRRPQCPVCGDPALVARQVRRPVTPVARGKATGVDRAMDPDELFARYQSLVDPVTGVVADLHPDPRLPVGIHCYLSGRNLAMTARDLAGVRSGLRSFSGGKGATAQEARVGALCEAVERYCGTWQGDEPTIRDSLSGLGDQAIHPNACQLFADFQIRDRHRWNATHPVMHQVCGPFDPAAPTGWTPVWSLSAGTHRLLPTSMLYFRVDGANPGGPWADSNGNAAGASREDAIVHGFLELVERDAVALWWYNRTRQPAVDLDAFDQPWLAALRDTYARMGRELWVLDLTSDLQIPAMVAISRRSDRPVEDITLGFGAAFDPRLAVRRAVTELGQLLPAVTGDDGYRVSDPELVSWWTTATVTNQPYLAPDPGQRPRTPADYRYRPRADLGEDVAAVQRLVRAHGLELLVLDQTRPDIGMPVVKVIVPGMRHFWARFALGRLYDVPVRLGRLARPTRPADLNPVPLFA